MEIVAQASGDSLDLAMRFMTRYGRKEHMRIWGAIIDLSTPTFNADCTWSVAPTPKAIERITKQTKGSIAPTYVPTDVVSLHRKELSPGVYDYYLRCSCGLYKRELTPCAAMIKVKRGVVDAAAGDVHPLHFEQYGKWGPTMATSFDAGRYDGPSAAGIPLLELEAAKSAMDMRPQPFTPQSTFLELPGVTRLDMDELEEAEPGPEFHEARGYLSLIAYFESRGR
jgi:hypothetical protein